VSVGQTKTLVLSLHGLAWTYALQLAASTNWPRGQDGSEYVGRRVTGVTGHCDEYQSSKQS